MTAEADFEGGCLCSAVRWRASGTPTRVVHCHCEMCRRSSGAAFITAAAYPAAAVRREAGELTWYQSSPEASRGSCARCGNWSSRRRGEDVWLTVGTFDEPENVTPQEHHMAESQLPWVKQLDDGLPRDTGHRQA